MIDIIVGVFFMAIGVIILFRSTRRPPELIGRNEAVKRMLAK